MLQHRVPHAPVRNLDEVVNDPNMHARGTLRRMKHPEYGEVVLPHSPIRFDGNPLVALEPSSRLGAHNMSVYGDWLGLSPAEVEALARDEVI
jgi:formyl-CoA transferase